MLVLSQRSNGIETQQSDKDNEKTVRLIQLVRKIQKGRTEKNENYDIRKNDARFVKVKTVCAETCCRKGDAETMEKTALVQHGGVADVFG